MGGRLALHTAATLGDRIAAAANSTAAIRPPTTARTARATTRRASRRSCWSLTPIRTAPCQPIGSRGWKRPWRRNRTGFIRCLPWGWHVPCVNSVRASGLPDGFGKAFPLDRRVRIVCSVGDHLEGHHGEPVVGSEARGQSGARSCLTVREPPAHAHCAPPPSAATGKPLSPPRPPRAPR
ncbi:hypothetical protein [Nocardia sp. NPDC004260]